MFLTTAQLRELTKRSRCDAQVSALRSMAIPFVIRPDGSPAVLCRYVEGLLGVQETARVEKDQTPDWTSLNATLPPKA